MAKKLYVGGLAYQTTKAEVDELFSSIDPTANFALILDPTTRESKGFGFIEFQNDEDADKAIQEFNEYELAGRKLTVNEARPREDRKPGGNGGGGYNANRGGGSRY